LKSISARGEPLAQPSGTRPRRLTLLVVIAGLALLGFVKPPRIRGQSPSTTLPPSFEVASIKPNHSGAQQIMIMFRPGTFTTKGTTVKLLITIAYGVKEFQVSGGPGWINTDRFDVDGKMSDTEVEYLNKLPPDQQSTRMGLMVQGLLADRFQLKVSHATKDLPVYALVVAKNGPKLHEAKPGDTYPNGIKGLDGVAHPGIMRMGPGQINGQALQMRQLATMLSQILGRDILDQTGLKGQYDINLQWTPDVGEGMMFGEHAGPKPPGDNPAPPESTGPSIYTALQEQLGLKLDSTKGPVEIIVVDHVEQPSEN
jgi:uncharacterized protein (TIGR03435 family)